MQGEFFSLIKTKIFILLTAVFAYFTAGTAVFAHQPNLVFLQKTDIEITNPEISRAFYDELSGVSKNYFINSDKDFNLYVNLLVPEISNKDGRYSANIFLIKPDNFEEQIATLDASAVEWKEFYESFGRDYYLKGPEFEQKFVAGKYRVEVFSPDNLGKYVLAVGKTEKFDAMGILNVFWQIPLLKIKFFNSSILQFFFTPFFIAGVAVIGSILIILAFLNYIIGAILLKIKQAKARTILLTSSGMQMKNEIVKLLQKPAYDITVAFITTAAKPQENKDYVNQDLQTMKDLGFNVQEIDIEGKTEIQVFKMIELKDIIYVAGGNTYYLLKAMRKCHFERTIRKLLKQGKVYLGVSAGSIVAGKSIKTAGWVGDENIVKLRSLKGMNLVPFDIFPHYDLKYDEIIKKKAPFRWQRKKIKFLKDDQAILVQGKNVVLLGNQEEVMI
jgi:dipeptidase E